MAPVRRDVALEAAGTPLAERICQSGSTAGLRSGPGSSPAVVLVG